VGVAQAQAADLGGVRRADFVCQQRVIFFAHLEEAAWREREAAGWGRQMSVITAAVVTLGLIAVAFIALVYLMALLAPED
jgi:hypothetical protein